MSTPGFRIVPRFLVRAMLQCMTSSFDMNGNSINRSSINFWVEQTTYLIILTCSWLLWYSLNFGGVPMTRWLCKLTSDWMGVNEEGCGWLVVDCFHFTEWLRTSRLVAFGTYVKNVRITHVYEIRLLFLLVLQCIIQFSLRTWWIINIREHTRIKSRK